MIESKPDAGQLKNELVSKYPSKIAKKRGNQMVENSVAEDGTMVEVGSLTIPRARALLDAVHEQFAPLAVTPTVPLPPVVPYGLPSDTVLSVTLHASGSCVIWNGCPPITIVPERG